MRLVHVGRPWARPGTFDLVVSTPQYFLPEASDVLVNPLPLHRITRERVERPPRGLRRASRICRGP